MKKFVAILLVLFLIIGGLAACDQTEPVEPEETPTVETTPPAEEAEETEEPEEEEIEIEQRHEPDEEILAELVERAMDFHSVLDTQTGAIFTLGDAQYVFKGILGEAGAFADELHHANDGPFLLTMAGVVEMLVFGEDELAVGFRDGVATLILSMTDRFALKDATVNMTAADLPESFSELNLSEDVAMHIRGITLAGEPDLLPVALHEHLQSDAELVVHQAYVTDDNVIALAIMIHPM